MNRKLFKMALVSRFWRNLIQAFALILFLFTVAAWAGAFDWRLDLIAHFRPFYAVISLVLAVIFCFMGHLRWVVLAGLSGLFNILPLIELYLPQHQAESDIVFKLVQMNVCAPKQNFSETSHFLLKEKPDLVALEECNERCLYALKTDGVLSHYPYVFRKTPYRHRLVALSRYSLVETPISLPGNPAVALLRITVRGSRVMLAIMHSPRPSSSEADVNAQLFQFKALAGYVRSTPTTPFIVAGDLNTSPWSVPLQKLLKDSGLRDSLRGFGFQPSFPTFIPHAEKLPVMPFLAIDHVLVSYHFSVYQRFLSPTLQSDHLAVIVLLGLRKSQAPAGVAGA